MRLLSTQYLSVWLDQKWRHLGHLVTNGHRDAPGRGRLPHRWSHRVTITYAHYHWYTDPDNLWPCEYSLKDIYLDFKNNRYRNSLTHSDARA